MTSAVTHLMCWPHIRARFENYGRRVQGLYDFRNFKQLALGRFRRCVACASVKDRNTSGRIRLARAGADRGVGAGCATPARAPEVFRTPDSGANSAKRYNRLASTALKFIGFVRSKRPNLLLVFKTPHGQGNPLATLLGQGISRCQSSIDTAAALTRKH